MYKIKILIADDNEGYRESIKNIINSQEDMEVIADTGDGEGAFKLALEKEPEFIVMDVQMPGLTGDVATQKIRKDLFGVKILMMSGNNYEGEELNAIKKQADGFLSKSCDTEEMLKTIRYLYKHKRP